MGGYGSGRHRAKHQTIEAARRINATGDEAKAFQVARVFQSMPGHRAARVMGLCPRCGQPSRFLFVVEGGVKCRACASLTYLSSQMQHSRTRRLAKQKPRLSSGVSALETWLKCPEQSGEEYQTAMATFEAIEKFSPDAGEAEAATEESGAAPSQRAATIKSDIEKPGTMLSQLEEAIVNTSPDSAMLPKLVNAYVALSNMRDARAKVADDLQRGFSPDDGPTIEDLLIASRLRALGREGEEFRRAYEFVSSVPQNSALR